MSKKVYVKVPKIIFITQLAVVPLFMIFGFVFFFIADEEVRIFVAIFVAIWEAVCIALLINAAKLLKRIRDGKIEVAVISEPAEEEKNDFSKQLRDLEGLKADGLISDDEYQEKREEILKIKR